MPRKLAAMKLVLHDRWGTALGVRATHDAAFVEALTRTVPAAHRTFDAAEQVWLLHPSAIPDAFALIESFYREVCWDPMILRDMEEVPVPPGTPYPVRTADDVHYRTLGVPAGATVVECRARMSEVRRSYCAGAITREDYDRAQESFERIARYTPDDEAAAPSDASPSADADPWYEPDGGEARARAAIAALERRTRGDAG